MPKYNLCVIALCDKMRYYIKSASNEAQAKQFVNKNETKELNLEWYGF